MSAHRGRVRTKFPRKLRLNSGRLLGQPRSALDSVTTKYETIFPCNPEHQVPELMPINIPLHNIGQDMDRARATSSEYSMPDLAMCNVIHL